jgi:hypothetical protein
MLVYISLEVNNENTMGVFSLLYLFGILAR